MNWNFTARPADQVIAYLVSFVIAITIHEFMHAWTANRFGDHTARNLGRITLNPIAHFDPMGFFGMVLIALGFPFIGWGKPVPVNPGNFRGKWAQHRHRGMTLVAAAGPLSNVAQALVMAIPFQLILRNEWQVSDPVWTFITVYIQANILLAAFNMIPVFPLDGYRILNGILPDFWRPILQPLEQYGFIVLLMLLFVGGRYGDSIIGGIMNPVRDSLTQLVTIGL
ncbi:MAG TPA: site-2 protease family protein [Thermomicrobiales bacterium]|nr:site-2 protease family protein [Thermomicrobiales bacterium]